MPQTVLVAAGPTREKLDPVRFITNESTGYLGYEIAKEAKRLGYRVKFVLGPTNLNPIKGVEYFPIESAKELEATLKKLIPEADYFFMSSAVCDFTPVDRATKKIKRQESLTIQLKKNKDILRSLSVPRLKKDKTYIAFCVETENLIENARKKLNDKRADLIIANETTKTFSPFGNKAFCPHIVDREGKVTKFENISKRSFAKKLWNYLKKMSYQLD